jgi:ectoine hydroxylase-related dioxygenase (phytanoyl-CoA dioxygenase family)
MQADVEQRLTPEQQARYDEQGFVRQVLPGSHREPVHEHVADRRPGANLGYVDIVDHDMSAAEPVLMDPGDLLLFDSHLMHRSTDNTSPGIRAAMVYHDAATGTVDHRNGPVNDFVTVR